MLIVQRVQDAEEAQRWKRKFLDALEHHEQREKILGARIRLLRQIKKFNADLPAAPSAD